jgi:hypothetical protein
MGWAFGTNESGREIGYGVRSTCDFPGCGVAVDRGMWYACGGYHDTNCGGYFCEEHLYRDCRGAHGVPKSKRHWQRRVA